MMIEQFLNKIYRFGKRYFGLIAVVSLLRFSLILLMLWLSVALADGFFYFSEITRWGLWIINFAIVIILFFRFVFSPLKAFVTFSPKSDFSFLAQMLGRLFPEIEDDLINAYQLVKRHYEKNISNELREAAIHQIIRRYEKYDFNSAIQLKSLFPEWRWALILFLGSLLLIGFMRHSLWHSTLRLLNPTDPYIQLPAFQFKVMPGDTSVVKGDPLKITAYYTGPTLAKCVLLIQQNDQIKSSICERNGNQYWTLIENVQKPFQYQLAGEPLLKKGLEDFLTSSKYRVKVITLPFVKILDVTVQPPVYTGLRMQKLARNIGDVQALKGSKISFRIVSNKSLRQAKIVFNKNGSVPLHINDYVASGQMVLKTNESYYIALTDTAGWHNKNPIHYQLTVLSDYQPFIEITRPGEDLELTLDSQLLIEMEARDDFGISRIQLAYQIIHQMSTDSAWQFIELPLTEAEDSHIRVNYLFDFNKLPLAFGDRLRYYALAFDNNTIDGPKKGKSRVYEVRFPSLEEIYQTVDEKQQESVQDVKEVTKEAKSLKENLEKIKRQLKQTQKLDWEKKNQLTQALEKQKQLQKRIEQIQKKLDEVVKKLEQNNLISDQLLRKYMKLQELFQQVLTPELEQALQRLNQALEKSLNPKEVEKALKEFQFNQKLFAEKIERTMELLKQVQFEQRLEEMVKKAQALQNQQKKISQQLEKKSPLNKNEQETLLRQQEKQTQLLERLRFDLKEMKQNPMLAKYPQTASQIDSVFNQMNAKQLLQKMQSLQQNIQKTQISEARASSQQLQQQFQQMAQSLQQAYQQMVNQNKQQIAQKMQQSLNQLLQLSKMQEQLLKKTKKTSPLSEKFNQLMREQGQLHDNLNKTIAKIVQLSKETFLLQPQMSLSLQKAARQMANALQQLGERFKGSAMQSQKQAMSALNQSIGQMMQSQQQLAQSASGTGFEKFLQQLQQMAGQQGQINDQTMSLFGQNGNQGKLTLIQQQALKRLAARQAALKKALEQLNEKMGQRENILGRLGQVAQEMDKVVKDLISQNINRKTIERQQRILSRLLDAQKSIREREYSKKRKAEKAKKYLAHDPGEMKNIYNVDLKQLQDALRKALQQGYNRDYQILIEDYFKKLIENYQKQKEH